jgi:hypothetical protein
MHDYACWLACIIRKKDERRERPEADSLSRGKESVLEDMVSHSCRPVPSNSGTFLICGSATLEKGLILPGIVPRFTNKTGGVMCTPMRVIFSHCAFYPTPLPVKRVDVSATI